MGDAAGFAALVAFVLFLAGRMVPATAAGMTDQRPRGIRNNNPGNIEYHPVNQWQGQDGHDGRYAIFVLPVYGIRAMARILDTYRARGVDTIAKIIPTWAPSSENPTAAYIGAIESITGIDRDHIITRANYPDLIAAMIYFENGEQPYSLETITEGIERA